MEFRGMEDPYSKYKADIQGTPWHSSKRWCVLPVFMDPIYDRVRSRELFVLTITATLLGVFGSVLLGNGRSCQEQRLIEDPQCNYTSDGQLMLLSQNNEGGRALIEQVLYFICLPVILLSNSMWSSRLWIIPAVMLTIGTSMEFITDYPYCLLSRLPGEQNPLDPSAPVAKRLCMDPGLNAYWPDIVTDEGGQPMFEPCGFLAMSTCENDVDNIYLDAVMQQMVHMLFFGVTLIIIILLLQQVADLFYECKICDGGHRIFGVMIEKKKNCLHFISRCERRRPPSVSLKSAVNLEAVSSRFTLDDPFEYPPRLLLGAFACLVVLTILMSYIALVMSDIIDQAATAFADFPFLADIFEELGIALIIGFSIAVLGAIAAIVCTLRAYRLTVMTMMEQGDRAEESLRTQQKMDEAMVVHCITTGTVRLGAASAFLGTWLAMVTFATMLCGGLVSILTLMFVVPLIRAIIWALLPTLATTLIPKVIQSLIPIIVDRCLVGTEPFQIKHPRLFFLVDLITMIVGGLASITTAVIEMIKSLVFYVINLYRIDRSCLPHPFTLNDSGFAQYCAVLKAHQYKLKARPIGTSSIPLFLRSDEERTFPI